MQRTLSVLVLLLFVTTASFAEEETSAERKAATAVRAKLPAPSPANRLSYEGDLVIDTLWAGEITYGAQAKKFAGQSVWYVTENVFIDVGGAELHYKAAYHLGADLALRSGSAECKHRGFTVSVFFARKGDDIQLMRTVKPPKGKSEVKQLSFPTPADATCGRVAVLLFLRGLDPKAKETPAYELPWFPLWEYTTQPATHAGAREVPTPVKELSLVIRGNRKSAKKEGETDWLVDTSRGERTVRLFLDPAKKGLRRADAGKQALSVVPRGEGGERIKTDEEKPAKTWQQAFLKFGFGYHMARRELIEEAFHWQSFYDYETKVAKSWNASQPVDAFKDAWIGEFLTQSMRRTRQATERLLSMTLGTGAIQKQTKDTVVFAAHANFGGGTQRTYHLKRVDKLWYIWRIDF